MKKIVSLPEDPIEVARRFRHLVSAATEQFNAGNLGRAVQMFELATKLAGEKKVEAGFMEPIVRKGHEALEDRRLRQYMDRPDRHAQLQAVMAFFAPGLGPAALLDQLEIEERRDKRKLLLDLLVVHGEAARAVARARLEASLEAAASDFARRNWIYLLRLVPRPAGQAVDGEIDAVARFASPGNPAFLAKEALTHLGQARHPRAAGALVSLLGAWEAELEREDLDEAAREEGIASLDRVASALARQERPEGWRALVEHALSAGPELGGTTGRLAELGHARFLPPRPDVVETLVGAVPRPARGYARQAVGPRPTTCRPSSAPWPARAPRRIRAFLEEVTGGGRSRPAARPPRAQGRPAPPAPGRGGRPARRARPVPPAGPAAPSGGGRPTAPSTCCRRERRCPCLRSASRTAAGHRALGAPARAGPRSTSS